MVIRGRLAFALVLFFIPATALAQRATTGTVTGKVVDTSGALDFIRRSLGPDGRFVMIDLLAPSDTVTTSPLHHLYGLIERGASIRCDDDNVRLLEAQFDVVRAGVARTHLLSMRRSPLYTNLGMYVCRPRASATVMSVGDGLRLAHVKKSP